MRSPNLRMTISSAKTLAVLALLFIVPELSLAQYDISTIAGGGPNGLTAVASSIGYADSVVMDAAGNTYIADSWSSRILKLSAATGTVTVVAGNGTHGYSGDGGPATSATLDGPVGVAVDSSGNIFIADTGNSLIREVTVANGNIQTVAGSFKLGAGYSGDGGPATSAQLNGPQSVFVDSLANVFIADSLNDAVREVVASTGKIQTVAGNGTFCADPTTACGDGGVATSANLDLPSGVFVDGSGNIFIADTYTARVRVVNTNTSPSTTIAGVTIPLGDIQTVAGAYYNPGAGEACGTYTSSGVALTTDLCGPTGVFVDASEDIFIADSGYSVIWKIAAGSTNIATVAGNGTAGYFGDTGAATSAELDNPNTMFVDSTGDIFIADTNNFVIREVTASNGDINTVIGNNTLGDSGDGGVATNAQLNFPGGVFLDSAGDVFIADSLSSVIREVVASSGPIQTVAGDPKTPCPPSSTASCGDGGPAVSAQFNSPYGVAVDAAGNVYIADTGINRIRVVNTGSASITIDGIAIGPGDVATVAGTGTECAPANYSTCGDGGPATSAELFEPFDIFVDSARNIFIADTDDYTIRVVNTGSVAITLAGVTIQPGAIGTVAGNGTKCAQDNAACGDGAAATSAQLSFPEEIFVDSSENLYIADSGDNRIRVVNTGTNPVTIAGVTIQPGFIATVAGTGLEGYTGDGAAATSAQLASPNGVFVDASGNIFISDNANYVIREVVASTGFIGTVAGNNASGFSGDGGQSLSAQINATQGLFGDASGDLFIADTDNSRIRELTISATQPSANQPPPQTTSPGGTATYDIKLNAHTGDPRYAITLSCLQSSLPPNATCSFSPAKITPGPAPVPFTLTISVPSVSGALKRLGGEPLQLALAFVPLAGILLSGIGLGNRRQRWMLPVVLGVALILLNACGGGGSGTGSGSGTTYNVQVQGTPQGQPTVTITTAVLTVQ